MSMIFTAEERKKAMSAFKKPMTELQKKRLAAIFDNKHDPGPSWLAASKVRAMKKSRSHAKRSSSTK